MKQLAVFSTLALVLGIAGAAFTAAIPDEGPTSSTAAARPTAACCQTTELVADVLGETEESACCSASNPAAISSADHQSCSDAESKFENKHAGGCCMKLSDTVAAKHAGCEDNGCKKPVGESKASTVDSESPQPESEKCEFCVEETCKQPCSGCTDANQKTANRQSQPNATHGVGKGRAHGRGMGFGRKADSQHEKDHQDFFFLLEHRESIRRTVKNLSNGYEALTESDDPQVAEMIQVHVAAMYDRVENGNPIRMRDPIFRSIFNHADKIKIEVEPTEHGVRVKETSDDAYGVKLLQEHAKVVSLWIKNGFAELPKNHPGPIE